MRDKKELARAYYKLTRLAGLNVIDVYCELKEYFKEESEKIVLTRAATLISTYINPAKVGINYVQRI